MRLLRLLPAVVLCLARVRAAVPPGEVALRYEDLDGDGADEIVLENDYLEVGLMTGVPPENAGDRPGKYGTRFVWGGWIHNMVFKPTGRRWFVNLERYNDYWYGIPEEFGQGVPIDPPGDGPLRALKIGVGLCEGEGLCQRWTLKLLEAAPWEREETGTATGGKRVTFTQRLETDNGYGYVYIKEFTLEPLDSRLRVSRELRNTGTRPIATTWYSHAFWGQGDHGVGYDVCSWSTLPLKPLEGESKLVDTARCFVPNPAPAGFWGPVDGKLIAEPWYASGHSGSRDLFVTSLDSHPAWFRMWTHPDTYSCEPFLTLDLEPGDTRRWEVMRAAANGLDDVRATGPGGALTWRYTPSTARHDGLLAVEFVPWHPVADADLTIDLTVSEGAAPRRLAARIAAADPTRPYRKTFPVTIPRAVYGIRAAVSAGGNALADADRVCDLRREHGTQWGANAEGASALLLSRMPPHSKTGEPVVARAVHFLDAYLQGAGFHVVTADPFADPDILNRSHVRLIVLAGTDLPDSLLAAVSERVARGCGLMVCGFPNERSFATVPVLPVLAAGEEKTAVERKPGDGTRLFEGASDWRYHLRSAGDHSITAGMPFFPECYQDVARFRALEPKPGADVPVRFAAGSQVRDATDLPALVTHAFGAGRVAAFACPVDWGEPGYWAIWSRLAEYHRALYVRTALWSAGLTD